MITPRTNMLKSELARKLKISMATLSRFMKKHEKEIKEVYPPYSKYSQIIYPVVIDFIIEKLGYSHEEIYTENTNKNNNDLQ